MADDGVGAAAGLALDEALMRRYARDEPACPPTLRLYSYRSHCALVGRYQNLAAEVDLSACRRTGTDVSRRLTGGGAIVMGSGQLGVAYVDRAPAGRRPREIIERFSAALATGLARLGIAASFHGKNDLEVGGRKIAGLGVYIDPDDAMVLHASILGDLDVEFMLEVLRIPAAKLADRAVAAVTDRLTTVTAETGSSPRRRHAPACDRERIRGELRRGLGTWCGGSERAGSRRGVGDRPVRVAVLVERAEPALDAGGSALLRTPADWPASTSLPMVTS